MHPEHDPEPKEPQHSPMEDAGEDPNATVGGPSSSSTTEGGGKRKALTLNVTKDYAELKRRRAEDDRQWSERVGGYEIGRRAAAGDPCAGGASLALDAVEQGVGLHGRRHGLATRDVERGVGLHGRRGLASRGRSTTMCGHQISARRVHRRPIAAGEGGDALLGWDCGAVLGWGCGARLGFHGGVRITFSLFISPPVRASRRSAARPRALWVRHPPASPTRTVG